MNLNQSATDLVTRLFRALVRHEQLLEVAGRGSALSGFVEARAAADDTPRIIGKKGAHYRAVAAFVQDGARRQGAALRLAPVLDPIHPGDGQRMPRFQPRPDWPEEALTALIRDTATWVFGPSVGVALLPSADRFSATVSIRVPRTVADEDLSRLSAHFVDLFQGIGLTHGVVLSIALQR